MKQLPTEIERCGDCPFAQMIKMGEDRHSVVLVCSKKFLEIEANVSDAGYIRVLHEAVDFDVNPDKIPNWCPLKDAV